MIFTLEALQANEGDCLLLHYGSKKDPKTIVIDGGPAGIYRNFLKPRLEEIKTALKVNDALPLSMVMVSHIDDDHVNGILAMTNEVKDDIENNLTPLVAIENLWINTFDDILNNSEIPLVATLPASNVASSATAMLPEFMELDHTISAVISSTGQGRKIRDNAKALSLMVNNPFDAIAKGKASLVRGDDKHSLVAWDDDLDIQVLHPNKKSLLELQKRWDEDVKKIKKSGSKKELIAALGDKPIDTSVFNVASIVCLVTYKGKKILLTGDATTNDIEEGLKINKLVKKDGKLKVDIIKLPHHGSDRNITKAFLEKVTANHYIISANGKHGNPDKDVLDAILDVFKDKKDVTVHLTNDNGELDLKKRMNAWQKQIKDSKAKFKVNFRKSNDLSLVIDLLEKIDF